MRSIVRQSKLRGQQRGTTLIETLVALLVLSIGLLGIAGLQLTSLQNNRGAHLRTQASVLAYDVADRMRANRTVALAGGYNVAIGSTPTGGSLEVKDLQIWKQTLAAQLPGGDGSISIAGNVVLITIQWADSLGAQQFTTRTQI